jgi:Trk K+ transport system NAD-binding subunit
VISRRAAICDRRLARQHREVAPGPHQARPQSRRLHPTLLIGHAARSVVVTVNGGHCVGGVVGDDHVAEHEPPARRERRRHAREQVSLFRAVEVVHGEHRDHEVERAVGEWILESRDDELDPVGRKRRAGVIEHPTARVDAGERCVRMPREYPPGGLAGTRPELEDAARARSRGARRLLLELLVVGHLLAHEREVTLRIPVEPGHAKEPKGNRPSGDTTPPDLRRWAMALGTRRSHDGSVAEAVEHEPRIEGAPEDAGCREWVDHVIVCGLHEVGLRTVEQLRLAGARVVVLDDDADERFARVVRGWGIPQLPRGAHLTEPLYDAGISGAAAVVCIESSDLKTLETVLLVRDLRPEVRIVAHLDNPAVARAVEEVTGAATVLDVAALFAPSVIEACLGRRAHDISLGSANFVTVEVIAPRSATLRELYGSLVPLGVATDADQEPVVCPGRDQRVSHGDRVTLLGTPEELAAAGIRTGAPAGADVAQVGHRALGGARRLIANLTVEGSRALRIALGCAVGLLVLSTLVLHFGYVTRTGHHLGIISAIYFTVETVATVGFGDFSFSTQPTWMEIFGIGLILAGTTMVTTIFALLTNTLVSRRIAQSLGQARIPGMSGHVVMVGLGSVGMEVLDGLLTRGREVVVVERDETNRYLNQVRQRGVPLVLGDSTLAQTLDSVNLSRASSVAIVTSDDLTNIETGLAVRDRLGDRWAEVPVVLRVFDRELGRRLEQSFHFRHVWSTVAIAAPWFVGAALGLEVLYSFYVGSHPFLLARLAVRSGGGLEGLAMSELSARIRVIAIDRAASGGELEHPPRRETRLESGDDAYLAGPYEELLRVLKREREGRTGDPS